MNINIVVQFQLEGIHRWKEVDAVIPNSTVSYLKFPHRHNFFFKCIKEVDHSNRSIEIIEFKRSVIDYLQNKYYIENSDCCYFDNMSCEQIAIELCNVFNLESCEVLEDNENGALITKGTITTPPYVYVSDDTQK